MSAQTEVQPKYPFSCAFKYPACSVTSYIRPFTGTSIFGFRTVLPPRCPTIIPKPESTAVVLELNTVHPTRKILASALQTRHTESIGGYTTSAHQNLFKAWDRKRGVDYATFRHCRKNNPFGRRTRALYDPVHGFIPKKVVHGQSLWVNICVG